MGCIIVEKTRTPHFRQRGRSCDGGRPAVRPVYIRTLILVWGCYCPMAQILTDGRLKTGKSQQIPHSSSPQITILRCRGFTENWTTNCVFLRSYGLLRNISAICFLSFLIHIVPPALILATLGLYPLVNYVSFIHLLSRHYFFKCLEYNLWVLWGYLT